MYNIDMYSLIIVREREKFERKCFEVNEGRKTKVVTYRFMRGSIIEFTA